MENAVDALKIAAAILIFIIAIASSFSLFGIAKQTADSIITMRDRQAYLESAELDGGILYTSSSEIQKGEKETTLGVTTKGDRIVGIEDIISTVSRYSKEKYGVTIVKENGEVLARYDSNTEDLIRIWNEIDTTEEINKRNKIIEDINKNIKNKYVSKVNIFDEGGLASLYQITTNITTDPDTPEKNRTYPPNTELIWGNPEEIQERIACDFKGGTFKKVSERKEIISGTEVTITTKKTYVGKGLISQLDRKKIVEVTNEIDNSKYLKQTDENGKEILDDERNEIDSNLLQEYTMPTIEVIYIILD